MKWGTSSLPKISEVSPGLIPWKAPSVALMRLHPQGDECEITHARTVGEKRDLLAQLGPADCVLVAWPGEYSQKIFWLDSADELKAVLSAPPARKSKS